MTTDTDQVTGTWQVKTGLAQMLKGGVIMDVVTPEQAVIAENAGANGAVVAENVKTKPISDGYNAATGEYVDMLVRIVNVSDGL